MGYLCSVLVFIRVNVSSIRKISRKMMNSVLVMLVVFVVMLVKLSRFVISEMMVKMRVYFSMVKFFFVGVGWVGGMVGRF